MIIAVIAALAAMQAAVGLDYLVALAEKVMRRHPRYIVFIAPVGCGARFLATLPSSSTISVQAATSSDSQ
jgi:anaerobic C4-dicarboxylate transporter